MRNYLACLALGCFCLIMACGGTAPGPAIQPTLNLLPPDQGPELTRGRVVDAASGQPVAGAVITLDNHPSLAWTDQNGNFVLRGGESPFASFDARNALLRCSHDAYKSTAGRYALDPAVPLTITLSPDPSATVFDPTIVRTYDFSLHPEALATMDREILKEEYVEARLVIDGEAMGTVGLRYKGSEYSLGTVVDAAGEKRPGEKVSLKVKFDEYDKKGEFHGVEVLNLQSMSVDSTRVREQLAYRAFRRMGIPAPRVAYARVRVNGSEQGLFDVLEQENQQFLARHFGKQGVLYKEIWPNEAFGEQIGENTAWPKTGADTGPLLATTALLKELAATDAERAWQAFYGDLAGKVDLMGLTRYLAVDQALVNCDGITTWYGDGSSARNHNFYLYQDKAGRLQVLPWDLTDTLIRRDYIQDLLGDLFWDDLEARGTVIDLWSEGDCHHAATSDPLFFLMAGPGHELYRQQASLVMRVVLDATDLESETRRLAVLAKPVLAAEPGFDLKTWQSSLDDFLASIDYYQRRFAAVVDRDGRQALVKAWEAQRRGNAAAVGPLVPGVIEDFEEGDSLPDGWRVESDGAEAKVSLKTGKSLAGKRSLNLSCNFRGNDEGSVTLIIPLGPEARDVHKLRGLVLELNASGGIFAELSVAGAGQHYALPGLGKGFSRDRNQRWAIDFRQLAKPDWEHEGQPASEILARAESLRLTIRPRDQATMGGKESVRIDSLLLVP